MDIGLQLQQTPNWSSLNAYERAKLCCQLLNTLGQPIPSWMQIRQWIGKGSANDIHRAKQDFLLDRQTIKAELMQQHDLPTALSGSLQDWWQQLKQAAEQEYSAEKQHWQKEKKEQNAQLAAAMQEIEQQQQNLTQLKIRIEQQQAEYQQVCEQLALKQQTLTAQQQQIEQLSDLLRSQQQRYLSEQASQHAAHMAQQRLIEERMEQRLASQLSAVADFQVFAAQQIDQVRQQAHQEKEQHRELLESIQHAIVRQNQQQQHLQKQLQAQFLSESPVKRRDRRRRSRPLFRF